jgi:Mycothiol maleylpyruvate isomerase N-terminal domain
VGWNRIDGLVETLSSEELVRPGYTDEGWSVKDMMAHVAAWSDYTARVLDEMRAGTWKGDDPSDEPGGVDRMNDEWFERDRHLGFEQVRSAWREARGRLLDAFGALEEVTPDAEEWFEETGPSHYAEHSTDLVAWTSRLRAER